MKKNLIADRFQLLNIWRTFCINDMLKTAYFLRLTKVVGYFAGESGQTLNFNHYEAN